MTAEPYPDGRAHLLDELARVDRILEGYTEHWRRQQDGADDSAGLYISDEEVDRILGRDGRRTPRRVSLAGPDPDAMRSETGARVAATPAETVLPLDAVRERFGLDEQAVDALLLTVAPALDLDYGTVYAYLQDDLTQTQPTVSLLVRVLGRTKGERLDARRLFADMAPLPDWGLVRRREPEAGAPLLAHRVTADRRLVSLLVGTDPGGNGSLADTTEPAGSIAPAGRAADPTADAGDERRAIPETTVPRTTDGEAAGRVRSGGGQSRADPARLADGMPGYLARVEPTGHSDELPITDGDREAVGRLTLAPGDPPVRQFVTGPRGVGVDAAVEAMAEPLGRPLLRTPASTVWPTGDRSGGPRGDGGSEPERFRALRREARLQGALVHLTGLHRLESEAADRLVAALDRLDGHVFLSGASDAPERGGGDGHRVGSGWHPPRDRTTHTVATLALSRPGYRRRLDLWEERTEEVDADLDVDALAGTFSLTAGRIEDALADARRHHAGQLTTEAVSAACSRQTRQTLGSLARRTTPTYDWEDIVLPADERRQLREVAAHVAHRGTVYGDWGFGDRFSLGGGLNVLFSGPSGTGKTMAAEIIAGQAGLDLFKIDLASVVSKYVGETERHLRQIFDEAEHSDAVLFFDEADALFGERSEVSDSQDRYANVEVSYLLQRMEEHEGTVVMTSNLAENIDDAFRRRINVHVTFPRPDERAREEIWRRVFPAETPVGDLDYPFLRTFDLTGGNIKNVALTASVLAAEDGDEGPGNDPGTRVEMGHVVRALRRELQKAGRLVNPDDFGEYRECIRW